MLISKLEEFYAPEPLEIAEIYVFRKRMQQADESTQAYMAALQKLSLHCKFGIYLKTELRNQFVFGLRNQRIEGRLLETVNLTMESALKTACAMELAEKGVNELKSEPVVAVDSVGVGSKMAKKIANKGQDNKRPTTRYEKKRSHTSNGGSKIRNNVASNSKTNKIIFFRCEQNHLASVCTLPRSIKCRECGGLGHLQKVCKKKGQTHMLEICGVEIAEHSSYRDRYMVSLCLERRSIVFEVNCGAAVTLVS